jgi:hypothetical protein
MKNLTCALFLVTMSFGAYAERNILNTPDMAQEKEKSSQDEKNVIRDSDEDNYVKSSENPLNDDAFDLHPDPDEIQPDLDKIKNL